MTDLRDPARAHLPLVSPRLLLRGFRLADLADVHAYASDPEVTRYLRWGPNEITQTARFLRDAIAARKAPERGLYSLAITERTSGRVCGSLRLHRRRPALIEVGYCLSRPVWGRGYATEALRTALPFARRRFPGAALFGLVVPENAASIRVLERCGFTGESDAAAYAPWMDGLCSTARVFLLPPVR